MNFSITKVEGIYKLSLAGERQRVAVLEMKPQSLETRLRKGVWLVLVVAVWSVPDRESLREFLRSEGQWPSGLRLAVRLFDDYSEAETWCPSIVGELGTPIWVAMKDGRPLGRLVGLQTREQVIRWLSEIVPPVVP